MIILKAILDIYFISYILFAPNLSSLSKINFINNKKCLHVTICSDGRIKIIGGASIEGLLFSPKKLPYKYLQVWYFGFENIYIWLFVH